MSNEIIKVLDALAEKFGVVIDWTAANIIPYLQELCGKYVNYEIVTSTVWIIIGIILLTGTFFGWRRIDGLSDEDEDLAFSFTIILLVISIATSYVIISQIFDIVTCYTFPEKIIIEELQSIYSSMNGN